MFRISLDIGRNEVIALIGPSGCGKSTFLRCLNRMNDTIDGYRVSQRTGYFHLGDLIEVGPTDHIFLNPLHQLTEDYITGRFG